MRFPFANRSIFGLVAFGLTIVPSLGMAKPIKNLILLIGDGMGPQQVTFGMIYARQSPDSPYKDGLHMEKMMRSGKTGFMTTYPKGAIVADSASAATQLATGHFSGSEMIGVDFDGNRQPTILEKAKKAGKATGLVSTARITHATPAAFAAHQPHRSLENEIAEDLIAAQPDVMLSAGYRYFLPKSVERQGTASQIKWRSKIPAHFPLNSSRADEIDLLSTAESNGYQLSFDFASLQAVQSGKVLGLYGSAAMPSAIDEQRYENDPKRVLPTLRDMTAKAIEVLAKDKDGFFLMIESGQIDWAGHANDAGTMLNEILQFDKTIGDVLAFAEKSGDTLVVLTADHETGSFGFSYSKYEVPKPRKLKGDAFSESLFAPRYNFGDPLVLEKLKNQNKTMGDIFAEFDGLERAQRTAAKLVEIVDRAMGFELTIEEATEILAASAPDAKPTNSAIMEDLKSSYVYGDGRSNLLGRALAKEQQVVWGTGTHTMTIVPLVVVGPAEARETFQGVMHSTEVGQSMIRSLGLAFP